jgi:hypothetical protein
MKPIEEDLAARQQVWEAMQMLFMDTSQYYELPRIAQACARSPYTVAELRSILFLEVFPACRFNMTPLMWPGGEWTGLDRERLTERILLKHRHGRRPLLMGWLQTAYWWARLKPRIQALRKDDGFSGSPRTRLAKPPTGESSG